LLKELNLHIYILSPALLLKKSYFLLYDKTNMAHNWMLLYLDNTIPAIDVVPQQLLKRSNSGITLHTSY
jgi:hypothetical protein